MADSRWPAGKEQGSPPSSRAGPDRKKRPSPPAASGPRRVGRRPFNVPWPGLVERYVLLVRRSFENLPALAGDRCNHVACLRVSDHGRSVPRRSSPMQGDEKTERRVETVLIAFRRRGKPRRFVRPCRQRREVQRIGVAPDGRCNQLPVGQREMPVLRVVTRRAPARHDGRCQRRQGKRGEHLHQMQSVRCRAGGGRIFPSPEPIQESPDRSVRTEHRTLSAIGRLNASTQSGD